MKFFKWAKLYGPREIYKKFMGPSFVKKSSKSEAKNEESSIVKESKAKKKKIILRKNKAA